MGQVLRGGGADDLRRRARLGAHRPPVSHPGKSQNWDLTVSVWSNPDVGEGSFFVVIDPPKGASVPSDIKVQVVVQPVSGRLPEQRYDAWREKLRNRVEFKALVPFDKEETWRVRILLTSAEVTGETDTEVPVTPTLLGRGSLLFFLLPFSRLRRSG